MFKKEDENENNFVMEVKGHKVVMDKGVLYIDECWYEVDEESPTHDLVQEIWRLRQFEEDHHSASRI